MTRTSVNGSPPAPSVVILGSDALVVCLPATPTQLANACFAAGFHGVFPASWGDELVAAGCVKALEQRSGPAIQCSCPLVLEQLRGVRSLHRYMVPLVSPPVATARYLRAMCEQAPLHITYVGDCPGADDPTIDRRMSPRELQALFEERGIVPSAQRPDLGDNPPRDRRRYYSLPGGVPAPEWLGTDWPKRVLVDTDASEALAELAHRAHGRENALIDLAPQLGCACSGAGPGVAAVDGRRSVTALEPPRARSDILDPKLAVEVFAAPVGEPPGPEVTWTDFLDSLPSTLSLDSQAHEQGTGPTTRSSRQSTKPHRRPSGQVALPRAYLRTRGNPRRPKEGRDAEAIFAATPPRAAAEGPSLRPSPDEAKPSEPRQERDPERPPRREESLTSARRREETLTSPRV
ncbi:MAG TPA: [Fe-Fe] hydrogenase large subunit C-terminal domain-containing protein, partial [Gemmatimonadaceae bacterium]|nr:[Fe-Fe] hydrogenase large subunit C-terminal domain-containing protein [Gemmatimonadaceae bacterium]